MLKYLIEKEIRDNIYSSRFMLSFAICSILILLAFTAGAGNYSQMMRQYEASKAENLRKLEGMTDWLSVRSYDIYLPPSPLASLFSGVSNDIGRTITVQGRGEVITKDSVFGENPLLAIFRFLDLGLVFTVLLTLFAILFAYDAVNGEKEKGTLRLIFSQPVPKGTFILAKIAGAVCTFLIPLLVPILLGIVVFSAAGITLMGDEWLRLGFILLLGFVLLAAFITMSVMVSSLTEKSNISFLVLLGLWTVLVLILPGTSGPIADLFVKVPNIDEINSQRSRLMSQLWNEDRQKMSDFKPSNIKDMQLVMKEFNNFMNELSQNRDKRVSELTDRLHEERKNRQDIRNGIAFTLARLSPAALFSLAAADIANSSENLKSSFVEQGKEYQNLYSAFMKEKTGILTGGFAFVIRTTDNDTKPEPINPREIPEFKYRDISAGEAVYSGLQDSVLLLLFAGIFLAAGYRSFLKFDVR